MPALDDVALDQLFRSARTYHGFLDTPVSEADLRAIWDLMKMGPTSMNQLPARLVWCVSQSAKDRLADCSAEKNAVKIRAAPVSVIIGMDENFHEYLPTFFPFGEPKAMFESNEPLRRTNAFRNSSLQGAYLIMAARALGLGVGPMSGFDNAKVDAAFFAETPHVKSNFIATLGYGDPETLRPRGPRPDFEQFNRVD